MTSTSISDAEFERLQNFILELKNSNYTLEEKCRKQCVETLEWKEKCQNLEKDLSKYQNLAKLNPLAFAKTFQLNKSQKEKELIDSLNEEKDFYQKKLQSQEDDFKLTNDMLRQEINSLMNEIKVLKTRSSIKDDLSDNSPNRCSSFNSNDSDCEITLQLSPNNQQKNKISYAILSEKEQLENSLDETTHSLNSFKEENQNLKIKINELTNRNTKLEQSLKQLKDTNISYLNELNSLKDKIELKEKEIVNLKELADKRKSTIDELQCHFQDTSDKAELAIENANKRINEIRSSTSKELSLLKTEKRDLMNKIEDLQKRINASNEKNAQDELQCNKLILETEQLKDEAKKLKEQLEDHEANMILIEKLEDEKEKIVLRLHDENELKLKDLNELNESLKEQLNQKDSLIKKLRQDVEDQIEERKIHEKRGVMYVRELKKQLNNEKKMRERIQEKFGELQSEKSFDVGSKSFDTTSVGSWSWLDKNNSTTSIHSSTDGNLNTNGINSPISDVNSTITNGNLQNQILEKENTELVTRLTKLQQEKWALEEKVNNILLTIEKLESELEIKQKIISFYCMERRSDSIKHQNSNANEKFTVKKVVDFIKDKGSDDNLKEINRKLLRMLEETLTLNMSLQNNLEHLTNELQSTKSTK